jgi:hypothetical protein
MQPIVVLPSFTTDILVNLTEVRTPPILNIYKRSVAWLGRNIIADAYLFRKTGSFHRYA